MEKGHPHAHTAYAIYAEFAKSNLRMQNGLNRRIFNTTEVETGPNIRRDDTGVITLLPGTYRITGFSMVTMQTTFSPPVVKSNYPGYCLVYDTDQEANARDTHICVGTPATSSECNPSIFECVITCRQPRQISVGHQSGNDLLEPIYLTVYDVAGETSPYHVCARIAIYQMS
jgi:hypothetical protein